VADGLTPGYLRHRARYWRERAAKETDPDKQKRLRDTAAILDREANALEEQAAAAERLAKKR